MVARVVNLAAALVVTAALLFLAARGAGPLPPLGPTFLPGFGVWTAAADAKPPVRETLHLAGLQHPTSIVFESNGIAHIHASTDHDLFLATGYLHARFRLFQMDLLRRQGEGLLSQILGSAALSSDRFELRLGLIRTARAEWNMTRPGDPGRLALTAYAQGVNDRIREDERNHSLPLLFTMLGYGPTRWTPLDTLVIKGIMTQTLDFTDTPLDYALLVRSLGYARTMRWFPVLPPNGQHPYDPGPYGKKASPVPLPSQTSVSTVEYREVSALLGGLDRLPPTAIHKGSDSNNWAVNGPEVASGKSLMAGDPHLHQTLPAIWYEMGLDSPDYHVEGVSIPGTPVVLIGRNQHISWSLTDTQDQATLYYLERTDRTHSHEYFWKGAWRPMHRIRYAIPLKGGGTSQLTVYLTVHGPIINDKRLPGRSISVDWMGAIPSPDLDVLLKIDRAATFAAFRDALRGWHAPTHNFVYADERGNIGLISAGYYPQVRSGAPWLPLPGDGSADVVGTIPYNDIPQRYDPPSHFIFSANQRPVGPSYPYYIGTTLDFFDTGYRADRIWQVLHGRKGLTAADMKWLQLDVHDYLAEEMVPKLIEALHGGQLSAPERQSAALLGAWNDTMTASSPAASIWWTFWQHYRYDTFQPWWRATHVPLKRFSDLTVSNLQAPLDENLETWTLHGTRNPAFTLPNGSVRTAPQVMRQAFEETVSSLAKRLGGRPSTWQWGRIHRRHFESLALIPTLGYGPRSSGGDSWTVNAADSGLTATHGPSWRFVMDWGSRQGVGVYPGGQSENPLSHWYENGVPTWWNGRYNAMLGYAAAQARPGSVTWSLHP